MFWGIPAPSAEPTEPKKIETKPEESRKHDSNVWRFLAGKCIMESTKKQRRRIAMMIGAKTYVEQLKDAEYLELIKERDELIQSIKDFEEKEAVGDRSGDEWCIVSPSPVVKYQMYLEYLSALCAFMCEKYNKEYVRGERTLNNDALRARWTKKLGKWIRKF